MTRAKKTGNSKGANIAFEGTNDFGVEFINIRLSDDDKLTLSSWEEPGGDFLMELERLVDNGYKVSFSYDMRNVAWLVSLTGSKACTVEENQGKCMVSRGSSLPKAFNSMMFKLQKYCPDGLFPGSDVRNPSDFG